MRNLLGAACTSLVAASLSMAAGLPQTNLRGEYVEARTADVYTGPCFANGEVGLTGDLAVFGWKIQQGAWQGTNLDGLSVVAAVKASNTLGDVNHPFYPVRSVLIIDSRANAEQRLALRSFAQKMGGDLFEDVRAVYYQPITLAVKNDNIHTATATLTAGTLAQIRTRALAGGDDICHNEQVWYTPLTKTEHAMPAYTLASDFTGKGLGTTWSSPSKRSAFVASFHYEN